jgi:plasmid stabilization system protein ParE
MPAAPRRLPPAIADIVAAAEWYDDQQSGLGDDFVEEVNAAICSLSQIPLAHSVRFADVRCVRLKRFKPYGIYYYLWRDEVIVFALFHASRHPRWLQSRRHRLEE